MKLDRRSMFVMVLILLVGISLSYVSSTYAKYTGEVTGKGTAVVAKWSFEEDNKSNTFTIALDKTYNASTLVSGKIAPGTSGSFAITVVNTNSETGVGYTVTIGGAGENKLEGIPSNMVFYSDAAHSNEISVTNPLTGTLEPGDSDGEDVTIYWVWPYETEAGEGTTKDIEDAEDTADGVAAATMTLPVTITGVQVQPE